VNPERKTLYQLCWHLGASQGDIANLKGEDVDWTSNTVSFTRQKSGVAVLVHLGAEALNVFKDLPAEGVLFAPSRNAGWRASKPDARTYRRKMSVKSWPAYSLPSLPAPAPNPWQRGRSHFMRWVLIVLEM